MFSKELGTVTYSNVETSVSGSKKEFITCDDATKAPIKKVIQYEDAMGNIIEKVLFQWDVANCQWKGIRNMTYHYDYDNRLVSLTSTPWDRKEQAWSKKTEQMVYSYDNTGKLGKIERNEI